MKLQNHKKKEGILSLETVVKIALIVIALVILLYFIESFFSEADPYSAELICRGSVAARSEYHADIELSKVTLSPLLCKTQDNILLKGAPYKKEDEEKMDAVKKDIAEKIAQCWWMMGEGLVEDPFLKSTYSIQQCFPCYTFQIADDALEKKIITSTELTQYLFTTPYKPKSTGRTCYEQGGKCVDPDTCDMNNGWLTKASDSCSKDKVCCYHKKECINKGGSCVHKENSCKQGDLEYNEWYCSSVEKCCVDQDDVYTYGDYIQFYGGQGALVTQNDLTFDTKNTYTIAFRGPAAKCDWACWILRKTAGVSLGFNPAAVLLSVAGVLPEEAEQIMPGIRTTVEYKPFDQQWFQQNTDTRYIIIARQDELEPYCPSIEDIGGD